MNANTVMNPADGAGEEAVVLADAATDSGACPAGIEPVVRIREEHNISRRDIDPDALKVLYRLARNNFIAYLVGGGVRDLLLGRKPKDFDVSTNARPEQIRSLFRNCILIGRRFRLAHVRYGDKIIETSTFRSTPKLAADPADPDADLFQRDDNMFGSPQEDALRRDFTVNGLFYDIESFSIIDYVGGMEDLAARRIRSIGDPCIRFREDPVRMIRAVRFASRLGFVLDPETEDAIHKHGEELAKAAPARLLEEITRLFAFSAGEKAVRLLYSTGLLGVILPEVAAVLGSDKTDHDSVWKRLEALDTGDTVLPDATPGLIFAVLLLEPLKRHLGRDWGFDDAPRLKFDKVHAFLAPLSQRLKFPRKLVDRIVHIYLNQHRFSGNSGRGKRGSIANFVTQDAFHESLALAEIILTSEGGSQTRLNQWRDLLAERIYGRDDDRSPGHGGDRERGRRAQQPAPAQDESSERGDASASGPDQDESEELPSGKKLSRSARRRRNKRLKRLRTQETPGQSQSHAEAHGEPTAHSADEKDASSSQQPAAVAEVPDRSEEEKPAKSRARKSRSRKAAKTAGAVGAEAVVPAAEPESAEEPVKPLTAAAFWSVPEPEPAPEPEKKKRGRKPKGAGKSKSKAKEAEETIDAEKKEQPKPLPMDKADEADIPMHWLDEI